MSKEAMKFDGEKAPLDLVPSKALEQVALAFGYGAKKYARHNWTNGFDHSRLISAAMRHINSYNGGENLDPESSLSHIAHALACLMMLEEHRLRALGKDDRKIWPEVKSDTPSGEPSVSSKHAIVYNGLTLAFETAHNRN